MPKIGIKAKLYFSTSLLSDESAPDAATWTEIKNVKEVTLNLETGEADTTTRASAEQGWRTSASTLKDGSLEFEMNWETGDPAFAAIRDAWLDSGEIALAAMDGDIDGGNGAVQGLAANFAITNFSRSEPLDDTIKVSVTAKPSSFPGWYEVADASAT